MLQLIVDLAVMELVYLSQLFALLDHACCLLLEFHDLEVVAGLQFIFSGLDGADTPICLAVCADIGWAFGGGEVG